LSQIRASLAAEFLNAFLCAKASSALLLPAMLYQFRYVPERYRALLVNLGDIGWYATTSFFCNRAR
jgi:hypothetical protein